MDVSQVDSIDGDSVPIALLRLEKLMRDAPAPVDGVAPPRGPARTFNISVRRMVCRLPETAAEKRARQETAAAAEASRKRGADGELKAPPKREYEYVNGLRLYGALVQYVLGPVRGRLAGPDLSMVHGSEIRMLVGLIGLTGTDFTRGLPQAGAKSVYDMVQDLWPGLYSSYEKGAARFNPSRFLNKVVAGVYQAKFPKHCSGNGLRATLSTLGDSVLSERTRQSIPGEETLLCTARNVNWLLQYWVSACEDESQQYPDPIQADYGFARVKGKIGFAA